MKPATGAFTLSLRQPMLGGKINESLTGVTYNLDKSLERLAENEIRKGISSQQYTVTGANELAILLSDILGSNSILKSFFLSLVI